ncbi:uncharacterized protein LOC142330441 isoform X2 [Lycorma delicatula]
MSDKSPVKVPAGNGSFPSMDPSKLTNGFYFFSWPFGTPFIFVALIFIGPKSFHRATKAASRFKDGLQTKLLTANSQKKLGSDFPTKALLLPFVYSGVEGTLSTIRGIEDNINILTAGTLTGMLYRATSGNLLLCGKSGLTGLALSSLYCLWANQGESVDVGNKKKIENNNVWDE